MGLMAGRWEFWIDRGGTFTDVVARRADGTLVTHKLLSENPKRYDDAAIAGIREVLGLRDGERIPVEDIAAVKMGTTVATNALLERTGEPTVLVTTRGFADAPRIAYQNRPRIFARHIELPDLLHSVVIEATERLDAEGEVVTPLEPGSLRRELQEAFDRGFRSVAVVLMHAFRNPAHELRIGELAHEVGFTQVSLSHEVSPLMKLVSRGDTTIVDAYLSPILRRYVDQVSSALPGVKCQFMRSSGGLTEAHHFRGKDAILSGPAGGIVGMARTAQAAGLTRVIGFDMGGTSTDVSHYAGEFEREYDTQIAGVRVRAPMMSIHTVAAGGGSILQFDGQRYRVGPASAGADPGPVAYGKGGPLTVTDANVMLGRIQPAHFPAVFGDDGDEPLDAEEVARAFGDLADTIGDGRSPEEVAAGFLRIAVQQHGGRDQEDLGAARPRHHPLHPVHVRRRGWSARLRRRRRARHDPDPHPPLRRRPVGVRHGPRRRHGHPRDGRRDSPSRRWARAGSTPRSPRSSRTGPASCPTRASPASGWTWSAGPTSSTPAPTPRSRFPAVTSTGCSRSSSVSTGAGSRSSCRNVPSSWRPCRWS